MAIYFSEIITSLTELSNSAFCPYDSVVTGIKPINNTGQFAPEIIYVGKVSQANRLKSTTNSSFLLLKDESFRSHDNINAILCSNEQQFNKALQIIHDLFDDQIKLANCCETFLKVCQNVGTAQQLLDVGHEILGNPLLLVDVSLCFMAHAGGNSIENEPLWEWTLSKGYVTEEYVNSIMLNDTEQEKDGSELLIWESGLLNHRQLVGKIFRNGQPVAYLKILEYNKPITMFDEKLLVKLCKFLALVINDSNSFIPSSHTLIDSFFTALLNQKLYDHDAIKERAKSFSLKLFDNLYVFAIELVEMYRSREKIHHLKRKLQNYLKRDTILLYGEYMVVIYDTKEDSIFISDEYFLLSQLLKKYNCKMGVSKVFHKLYDLSEYYKQAVTCLRIGNELDLCDNIFLYDKLIVTHMILSFRDKTNLENLIHPAIKTLLALDTDKGSDLADTLFCYLENNQDMGRTSKVLHIHYNTLKYRIKRICELTNIDFGKNDLLFNIQLSHKVLQILKHK